MEHEKAYSLMMRALDEGLDGRQADQLDRHLIMCAACAREWQALQSIHQLFLQTPALSPVAGFTQRTLARLPDSRQRVWFLGLVYLTLLLSGVLPVIGLGWLALRFGQALLEPAIWGGLAQAAGQVGQLLATLLSALWLGLEGLATYASQHPLLWVYLLLLTAVVALWGGIYRQLILVNAPIRS
jgi:anti-sigma factor RsiW